MRSPFQRMRSIFRWVKQAPQHKATPIATVADDFESWLRHNLAAYRPQAFDALKYDSRALQATDCEIGSPFWFSPQVGWLSDDAARVVVDELYATEDLATFFQNYRLPAHRTNFTGSSAVELGASCAQLIRAFFKDDISLWEGLVAGRRDELVEDAPVMLNPTLRAKLTVEWDLRSRHPQRLQLDFHAEPELARFMVDLLSSQTERELDVSPELLGRLRELGIVIDEREAPAEASLDLSLSGAAGNGAPGTQRPAASAELAVNDRCCLGHGYEHAIAPRIQWSASLPAPERLLWVDDPGTGVLAAYDLEPRLDGVVRSLLAGDLAVSALPGDVVEPLIAANVLVAPGHNERRAAEWDAKCDDLRRQFRIDQVAVLRGVVHPLQLRSYADYLRRVERGWGLTLDQEPRLKRLMKQREPVCEFLHHQVLGLVNRIVDEPIKCSYSLYGLYLPGAQLLRHRDRPQCKWNMSFVIDATHGDDPDKGWPLFIESTRVHELRLGAGDAVIYSGTNATHWRDTQPEGNVTMAAFFHFVPADFTGSLD